MPYKEGKQYRATVMIDGERSTALKPTKKEALEWENQERKRMKEKQKNLQKGMDLLSLSARYLEYAQSHFSNKTYIEKNALCKRIMRYIGAESLVESIDLALAEKYLSKQLQDRSANAANKDRKNLCAMWNKAIKTWDVQYNPWADTDKFPHDVAPQLVPTIENVVKLLMVATRKERVILTAYLHTGARRSEIFRWLWHEDINFENRMVRIGTRKTHDRSMKYRWIEMSGELHDLLKWWWDNRTITSSPYVFVDDLPGPHYGQPYKVRRRFMKGLCKRAGIHEFGFHAMRRFFASMLADQKEDIKTIQTLLGHSRATTTDRYLYSIGVGKTRKAVEKMSFKKFLHEDLTRSKKEATDENG